MPELRFDDAIVGETVASKREGMVNVNPGVSIVLGNTVIAGVVCNGSSTGKSCLVAIALISQQVRRAEV